MDAKIQQALQLEKEGFNQAVIDAILENPELEAAIRDQLARARAETEQGKMEREMAELSNKINNIESKGHDLTFDEIGNLMALKRHQCDLRNHLASTG